MKIASIKKWIMVTAFVLMMCVCAAASARSYRVGDEAEEIAAIQTILTKLGMYSGDITGHYGEKRRPLSNASRNATTSRITALLTTKP